MCHGLWEAQDHSLLSFLLWVFCCFSVLVLFGFGFCLDFFFGWFVFSKNKLGEISVHMDVTGVDSVWTAVMQNS